MNPRPTQDALASPPVLRGRFVWAAVVVLSGLAAGGPAQAIANDWRVEEPFASVADRIADWLDKPEAVAAWRKGVTEAPAASRLSNALIAAASQADERVLAISSATEPPEWLDPNRAGNASLRLAIAEGLASQLRYDACLAWTEGLQADTVYSADLLCYLRALALSQLVDDDAAREELASWADVEAEEGVERLGVARWWVVRRLLDRSEQEPEPLPTVVRRMHDIQRRLSLDQSGEATQERQQRVVDELDELIEDLEEQRRQQQQQQLAGGGGGSGPSSPAEESRPSELKGPGEVDPKRLVKGDPWGALPPAERKRLTQAITRDLPSRYRALVEDYFRTLADGKETPDSEEGR